MTAYAAPFLGEFGWEVAVWAPWLRAQVNYVAGAELTVFCKPGHEVLYQDFAHRVIGMYQPALPVPDSVDCQNVWVKGARLHPQDYCEIIARKLRKKTVPGKQVLTPEKMPVIWQNDQPPVSFLCQWYRYGGDHAREITVAHMRHSPRNPDRNTPADAYPPVDVCIGHPDHADALSGAEDLRGVPLAEVVEILSRAKLVIGPSSGPLALAMLCGAPVVWWSPNAKDEKRFDWAWNPFEVKTVCAARKWAPSRAEVRRGVESALSLLAIEEPK